jgi:uncharacterized protein YbjT (DUF2867 family)
VNRILVTGALGNVGGEIIRESLSKGISVRAADVDLVALNSRFGDQLESVEFDFTRPETYKPALEDVKIIFLMRPPHISNVKRHMFPFIDAAKAAGVEQVIFLSLIGNERNQQVPHYKVEQYIKVSGMKYVFLRASYFMQNLSGIHQADIRNRDEIFLPVGQGKTSFIDVRDTAVVTLKLLTESWHDDQVYELTGPEVLDYDQVATILSNVLGREITHRNPSILAFIWNSLQQGKPLGLALVMSYLYTQTKRGMSAQVTRDVAEILGRNPISMDQFAIDYRHVWIKS